MGNSSGGTVISLFKFLFGDVPAQWVRLIILGAVAMATFFLARDFKHELLTESAATRAELSRYIQSNQVWQESSKEERARLLRKANARLNRLYMHNGWVYEEIEP